ncbi:hypothetical protein ACFWEJ_07030, partial [Promicromonospora sp. NPDC060204]|uniref:hypothetical protein n=1 Tax=Promicromonospora sp. NPDC060204 TaxID=3347071 RepID=UPI0036644CD3
MTAPASAEMQPSTFRSQRKTVPFELLHHALAHPILAATALALIALIIEFAQYRPEFTPGAHAISEFTRNIMYGLIGALIFQWIIVDLPDRKRRRATYIAHTLSFETLLIGGRASLAMYRHFQPSGSSKMDSWNEESVKQTALAIAQANPSFFHPHRAALMRNVILATQLALEDIRPSQAFLDPDVAQA